MNMHSDTTDIKAPSDSTLHPGSMLDSGLRKLAERMRALFRDAISQANAEVDDIVQNNDREGHGT
jgi:hypothetical protein